MNSLSDAEIMMLLVGKWYEEDNISHELEAKGTTTFRNDGTSVYKGTWLVEDLPVKFTMSGTWRVEDGILIETIKKIDPPILDADFTTRDRIVFITNDTVKLVMEDNRELVKRRISY